MNNSIKTTWTTIPLQTTIVAVTKTFPFEIITMARSMGLTHIGENRVEEARAKIEQAKAQGLNDVVWHMIGHVQSRKARDVVSLFDWVDSVDSIELLRKLDAAAQERSTSLHVLLEVNVAAEHSKYGFSADGLLGQLDGLKVRHIILEGLMTMAPYTQNAEENRTYFRALRELSETIRTQIPSFGSTLSMGTSCDYQVAIEEGATQVRLGEALFGARPVAK
jgi:pyridoxal phosphate enzyme (YggS family)